MHIGVPKEIKVHEYRVAMTPAGVREATHRGHSVIVERGAGAAIGFGDNAYREAGAEIASNAEAVFAAAELIVKVKEPQKSEFPLLRDGQALFTYLHLAPDPDQARSLMKAGVTAIAYETVTDPSGGLPCLKPMSAVAGRLAVQAGAHALEMEVGGRGVLLGGIAGVTPGDVVILGAGTVGTNAAAAAIGLGAQVTVIGRNLRKLEALAARFGSAIRTIYSTRDAIETHVQEADLVVGAVLVPGGQAPMLISEDLVKRMRKGAVIVDVSIDQGGIVETIHPTTHADPTFTLHGVVHYGVTNMPGAVARTSTMALSNATLPFTLALADKGIVPALKEDRHLLAGLNVCCGRITHRAVAEAVNETYTPAENALAA